MDIRRETSSYNQRRYGRPWIAKVVIKDGTLSYQWGQWIGDHSNGSEGLLVLTDVTPGTVYAQGQRDTRTLANSAPEFFVLGADGSDKYISKSEAYKLLIAATAEVDESIAGIGIGA